MTAKEVIQRLKADGWVESRQSGFHKVFKHSEKSGIVVIAVHGNKDIPPGTLNSIFKQAGWK